MIYLENCSPTVHLRTTKIDFNEENGKAKVWEKGAAGIALEKRTVN